MSIAVLTRRRRRSPWTPRMIPGLELMLESRSLSHLSPGDPVGSWPDLSGTGHHAVNATTSQKPTFRRSGSLPAVEFDGVDDLLDTTYTPGSSVTMVYVSVPVVDYGSPQQDGKWITYNRPGGIYAYVGAAVANPMRAKWALRYPSGDTFLNSDILTVGTPYMSALAVDLTGYTSYHNRSVSQTIARAEALAGTNRVTLGGSAKHRMVSLYTFSGRLTTPAYYQVYDYNRAWLAQYGVVLP